MDILDLRKEMDAVDRQLIDLFAQRMDIAAKIAAYKTEHQLPVYDPARESRILEKVSACAKPGFEDYTCELFRTLFALSRSYQNSLRERQDTSV